MLLPVLDLSDFTFRAVIDWVEIRVTLQQVTQFQWVQKIVDRALLRKSLVTAVNPGAGNVSDTFDVMIQEPPSLARVLEICNLIFFRYPGSAEPTIQGIEVSIDATPKAQSDENRALLFGAMQRTIFTSRDIVASERDRVRTSIGKGEESNRRLLPELYIEKGVSPTSLSPKMFKAPWIDGTFYFGERQSDMMVRIMDKIIDQQNHSAGTCRELEDVEKRVRIEVTLRGAELARMGLAKVEAMHSSSFSKLQGEYFQFKLPTFATRNLRGTASGAAEIYTDRSRAEVFLNAGVLGLDGLDRATKNFRSRSNANTRKMLKVLPRAARKYRPGMGSTGTLTSYGEMNSKVATALRHLGEREAAAWKKAV